MAASGPNLSTTWPCFGQTSLAVCRRGQRIFDRSTYASSDADDIGARDPANAIHATAQFRAAAERGRSARRVRDRIRSLLRAPTTARRRLRMTQADIPRGRWPPPRGRRPPPWHRGPDCAGLVPIWALPPRRSCRRSRHRYPGNSRSRATGPMRSGSMTSCHRADGRLPKGQADRHGPCSASVQRDRCCRLAALWRPSQGDGRELGAAISARGPVALGNACRRRASGRPGHSSRSSRSGCDDGAARRAPAHDRSRPPLRRSNAPFDGGGTVAVDGAGSRRDDQTGRGTQSQHRAAKDEPRPDGA